MKAVSTTRPAIAPLRLTRRRSARRAGLSSSSERAGEIARSTASVIASRPQPRVDEDIGDVGDEIQRDVDRRGRQHDALHHGIVAVEYGVDDQFAEAWY